MRELRLTVLRDKPASDILNKYAYNGYNLIHDTKTDLYFLTQGPKRDFKLNGFNSVYDRVLKIPYKYDGSYLKKLKADHKGLLGNTIIHNEIYRDALALSQTLSTRVFCVYSNDEDCDFAVTAENGKLIRLRFKAGQQKGNRVEDDIAAQIETEIHATRILMDGEELDDEGVFEYSAYEVLETADTPPGVNSYWQFYEGEIGGQVIFKTLQSSNDDVEPNLMFRNAFLEFEIAFGKAPPDFTDVFDESRFKLVGTQAPQKLSIIAKFAKSLGALLAFMFRSRNSALWSIIIILMLIGGFIEIIESKDEPEKARTFSQYCQSAGGVISGVKNSICKIGEQSYRTWNLPGEIGETRMMIFKVGPELVPCEDNELGKCLIVDGTKFEYEIENFSVKSGEDQIIPIQRIQICDPTIPDDCVEGQAAYAFKRFLMSKDK